MKSSVRPHLPEEELHAWLDDQLSTAQRVEIAEHLLECLVCRALEAEVRTLRDRSIELLAFAAPSINHGVPVLVKRFGFRPAAIAAAAIIAAAAGWTAFTPGLEGPPGTANSPRLSSVLIAPPIVVRAILGGGDSLAGRIGDALPVAVGTERASVIAASGARLSPRMRLSQVAAVRRPAVPTRLEFGPRDPLIDYYLPGSDYRGATQSVTTSVSHLDGIPIEAVRLEPSADGGRPTALVRQVLKDGDVVWIIEGAVSQVENITSVMAASGLTMALTRRTVPDYYGPDSAVTRSIRVVAVAARLPYDSLEVMTDRLLRLK